MKTWEPSENYHKIAEANRVFFAEFADRYESTETVMTSPRIQSRLELILDRILTLMQKPAGAIVALDACGGTGNVALKLLQRGVRVTLVDISPELQGVFREKCARLDLKAEVVSSEIAEFFSHTERKFDLITFSAALHHLENIDEVLGLAFERLVPGGLLFTALDPTLQEQISLVSRIILRLDYYTFKVLCQTADVPHAIRRRVCRMLSGLKADNKDEMPLTQTTVGVLSEYHVDAGIDDIALANRLQRRGFEIVWHERFAEARFWWNRRLIGLFKDVTSFRLLLRRPMDSTIRQT